MAIINTKLLIELINAFGVSGFEEEVRNIIEREIKKYVDDVYIDTLGNLIAHKKGNIPKVMLAAHMDEVGFIVRGISKNGNIYFSTIGGIEPLSLLGKNVILIGKEKIKGSITSQEFSDGEKVEKIDAKNLFVTTGLSPETLEKKGIEIGSYIALESKCYLQEDFILGKALDDRISCFILIELARRLKYVKNETYFVFTVQEEVGLYGAKTSSYEIQPAWAISVDVTTTDSKSFATRELGNGPCIIIKDSEVISNKCLNGWLRDIAKRKKIPVQLVVSETGTTEALTISMSRGGIPATSVGVAVENIHSSRSIASLRDIENCILLLEELLSNPPKVCLV